MDLETLRQGNFAQLGQAITAWKGVVDKLKGLETDARDDMKAKADKANWAGMNATISREFITKTAHEFSDAHTQATTIHDILKDTRDELVSYKEQLDQALERGRKKNLTVTPIAGGGFTVTMLIHPDRAAKGHEVPDHSPQDAEHLRDDVQRILNRATESDTTAATVLRAIVDQAETGFSGAKYGDRDSAIDAVRKAEEAAKLIKEKGDEMSPEEFQKLNGLLASYKNDPLFQEKFATQVGPKGMLDFWADLSSPDSTKDLTRTQLNQLGEFQKNLGFVLGGATQSDSPAMRQWENDMVKLGPERFRTRTGEAYGFQIMSNLMRTGDYDDQFLNKYGNSLVETEKKMRIPDRFYLMEPTLKMNFIGDAEFGRDPMAGFMTALSNSPDAATDFFNTKEPQDNAQWVLKDRPSFDDSPLKDGPNETLDATGAALAAAATGMNPNDPTARQVDLTPDHRKVLDRSLEYLSGRGDDFPSEMRDDMAKVLSRHSDVVHHSASSLSDNDQDPRQLDRSQLLEVTKQISRDQGAYGMLNEAMNREILNDIHSDHPSDPKETLQRGGATIGFLEEARYQALKTDKEDPSWDAKWLYHGFGGAANFIPVLGDAAQRGIDALAYQWQLDEQERINKGIQEQNSKTFDFRENQLRTLSEAWAKANPGHSNNAYTLENEINLAALNGNSRAKGLPGDQ
ncbi:DUF6571 family protein [Streptomyces vilmorinianum]|uniref:DUF6571 family protein n=1 Tax=Streptomyces vilmorinianum TaxID=3051092 RepID=UPI0010FB1E14|nr:DUF6571 family protein [Streptomyces vilmorinianum]